jgi:hypothetical protein
MHSIAVETAQKSVLLEPARTGGVAQVYHAIRAHCALSPLPTDDMSMQAQHENESDWCQALVNGILPLLLPPEDLSNPCLDVLVSEIFSNLIVRNAVLEKSAEPWLLWEGVTKAVHSLTTRTSRPAEETNSPPQSKLEQFGLLADADDVSQRSSKNSQRGILYTVAASFWSALEYAGLMWTLLRAFVIALMHAPSLPSRPGVGSHPQRTLNNVDVTGVVSNIHASSDLQPPAIIQMQVWSCLGRLVSLQRHMPWLAGFLSLTQWLSLNAFGGFSRTNSAFDR